jgi:hypothetical protein
MVCNVRSRGMIMRAIIVSICVLVVVFSFAARADEVKLKAGGKMSGTIVRVEMSVDGKTVKHEGKDISNVYFSPVNKDVLTLKDKTKVRGEFIAVVVKTAGGEISFNRADLADVSMKSDPVAEARREILAHRRGRLKPDDARGLLDLAKWAREKELADESHALATAAINVDPTSDLAVEAHKFLGHVLFDGEWMTKAEMARRKKIDEGVLEPEGTAKPEPSEKETETAKFKAVEALTDPKAQNAELCKVFLDKVEKARLRDLKGIYDTYNATRNQLNATLKKLEAEVKKAAANRGSAVYGGSVHTRSLPGGPANRASSSMSNKDLALKRESIRKLKGQRVRLEQAKRRTAAAISKKAVVRRNRVRATQNAINQRFAAGEQVAFEQMIATYKKAAE